VTELLPLVKGEREGFQIPFRENPLVPPFDKLRAGSLLKGERRKKKKGEAILSFLLVCFVADSSLRSELRLLAMTLA